MDVAQALTYPKLCCGFHIQSRPQRSKYILIVKHPLHVGSLGEVVLNLHMVTTFATYLRTYSIFPSCLEGRIVPRPCNLNQPLQIWNRFFPDHRFGACIYLHMPCLVPATASLVIVDKGQVSSIDDSKYYVYTITLL